MPVAQKTIKNPKPSYNNEDEEEEQIGKIMTTTTTTMNAEF
jgi:hypothetical protein